MATLKQIADEAGVSIDTVSRILTGKNKENRPSAIKRAEEIRRIAERLHYRPNRTARTLRSNQSHCLAVLWSFGSPHQSESMARAIALRAETHGYACYLFDHRKRIEQTCRLLEEAASRQVDGVVMQSSWDLAEQPSVQELLKAFRAVVVVTPRPLEIEVDQVVHDRTAALREIARHWSASGRRRPLVMLPPRSADGKDEALRDAFLELVPDGEVTIRHPVGHPATTGAHFGATLDSHYPDHFEHDAIWCSSDEGATVALRWVQNKGLAVPESVAVVGFNNAEIGRYLTPPLASVDRQEGELAEVIDRVLFHRLSNVNADCVREYVPMKFIWRPSAGGEGPTASQNEGHASTTERSSDTDYMS